MLIQVKTNEKNESNFHYRKNKRLKFVLLNILFQLLIKPSIYCIKTL